MILCFDKQCWNLYFQRFGRTSYEVGKDFKCKSKVHIFLSKEFAKFLKESKGHIISLQQEL